jgi:hypothetical protein
MGFIPYVTVGASIRILARDASPQSATSAYREQDPAAGSAWPPPGTSTPSNAPPNVSLALK